MAKYFKTPNNPHASSVEFFARADETRTDPYGVEEYPTAEVVLHRGGYDYGRPEMDNLYHNIYAKPGDQLKLFEQRPSKITQAFTDHSMRSHTPVVLGMAINEASKIGVGLTHDSDLSEHSAKLVKRGIASGVVTPNPHNPSAEQTNSIARDGLSTYEHTYRPYVFQDYDPVPDTEVRAGRETIRGIVNQHRQAKKAHMGPQFENNNPEGWYQPELGQ